MFTRVGSPGRDTLAGAGKSDFLLKGLGGNDLYTVRLFDVAVPQFSGPPKIVYLRDRVQEASGGGNDTVTFVNQYEAVGFTGITPLGDIGPKEVAHVEHIKASLTLRGTKAIGWEITAGSDDNTIDAPRSNDRLDGGSGDDQIHAGGGDDMLFGSAGADILFGDSGNDTLAGGSGRDLLDGGAGRDTVSFADSATGVTISLGTGKTSTHDRLHSIEGVIGSNRDDRLTASSKGNSLSGGSGNDYLVGGAGADTLEGGKGNDRLLGGGGNDVLNSGGGTDQMTGGFGHDTFRFDFAARQSTDSNHYIVYKRAVAFHDTITDFQNGVDYIGIHATNGAPNFDDIYVRQSGADTVITFGPSTGDDRHLHDVNYGTVTLHHFDVADLSTADFKVL